MVRLEFFTQLSYEVLDDACDFVFNIQAALTSRQRVVCESLQFSQGLCATFYTDPATFGRFMRLRAGRGSFTVSYGAVVELNHFEAEPADLHELSPVALPGRGAALSLPQPLLPVRPPADAGQH